MMAEWLLKETNRRGEQSQLILLLRRQGGMRLRFSGREVEEGTGGDGLC